MDIVSKMVGRENELKELQGLLDKAFENEGSMIFIEGEAGVGKTMLLSELLALAKSRGVRILQGWSLYESLTPYMPIIEALGSADLDYLFAREAPPRVECVYLATDSGLLIKEVLRTETALDPNIFTAMLNTVGNFVRDSIAMFSGENKKDALNSLGYENYRILIEREDNLNLVVILAGRENEFLINDMRKILFNVKEKFGEVLSPWDGNDKYIEGISQLLKPLIASGKYDGIDYTKGDPRIRRNVLFENILLGIVRYTRQNTSILAIEDLQWADPSSLALLHYIARNSKKCKLLIIGTYRPEDISGLRSGEVHHLVETFSLMRREDLLRTLKLTRLGKEDVCNMLDSWVGKNDFPQDFKNHLYKETEGNPFFVVELIRMLAAENIILEENAVWTLNRDTAEVHIPSKVQDVVIRRLDRLKQEGREIMDYGAIIGDEFAPDILAAAMNRDKVQVLKQLRILQQNHKLIRLSGNKFKFDHSKIKEVLYSLIPSELRREYHLIVANTIETQNRDRINEVMGDLAYHYFRCSEKQRSLPYLLLAAQAATDHYAPREARDYYNNALNVLDTMEDSLENKNNTLDVHVALGDNCFLRGEWDEAMHHFKSAEILSDEIGDKKRKAEIYGNLGLIHKNRNEWEIATSYFDKSMKISEEFGDGQRKAITYYCLGGMFDEKGDFEEANRHYALCKAIGESIGEPQELAKAYLGMGRIYAKKGDYDESVSAFKNAVSILSQMDNLRELSKAYANLGATYIYVDVDESIKYHNISIEIADKILDVRIKGYGFMNMAYSFIHKNRLELASDYLDEAFKIFEKLGEIMPMSMVYSNYGIINTRLGQWEQAIGYFELGLKICKELDIPYNCGCVYYEYGIMLRKKGEFEEAKKKLTKALDMFGRIQNKDMIQKVKKELKLLEHDAAS